LLPDFCEIRVVFALVLAGELAAVVLTLMAGSGPDFWGALGDTSLFVQWVCLGAAALLCLARAPLARAGTALAAGAALAAVLLATALSSVAASWVLDPGRRLALDELDLGFLGRNLAVSTVLALAALRYRYVQQQWRANLAREAQARIQALQSRIRPHFLFNSMNTIASLTRTDPALAERVVEDLADLFRASLGDARVPVTLGRELEVCRRYLEIESLRLGERLATTWDVQGLPTDAQLPALTVQPLLENAVYHGVEPAPGGGRVAVSGTSDGRMVELRVENTLPAAGATRRNGNRLAQENVGQRLQAFFGPQARLEAVEQAGVYRVALRFPLRGGTP
jgi:two-component system sensor histidine kinase AlgZ